MPEQSVDAEETQALRPRELLTRANTDYGPRRQLSVPKHDVVEENWELRHGWEDQYNSSEYLKLLSSVSVQEHGYRGYMIHNRS